MPRVSVCASRVPPAQTQGGWSRWLVGARRSYFARAAASMVKGEKPGAGSGPGALTGPGTGTDDGSRGTGAAAQPAPHLGDPDEQRACPMVLLIGDQAANAQDIQLRRCLSRASSGNLVRPLLVGFRGLPRTFSDVEENARAGPIELISKVSGHLARKRVRSRPRGTREPLDRPRASRDRRAAGPSPRPWTQSPSPCPAPSTHPVPVPHPVVGISLPWCQPIYHEPPTTPAHGSRVGPGLIGAGLACTGCIAPGMHRGRRPARAGSPPSARGGQSGPNSGPLCESVRAGVHLACRPDPQRTRRDIPSRPARLAIRPGVPGQRAPARRLTPERTGVIEDDVTDLVR
jgi:hypothetical protein